jgi:DNA-binding transcriptional ArsR family regulator
MTRQPEPDQEPVWRALANRQRREMLDTLRDGPLTTGALAEHFPDLSRFAVMQHLGVLEEGRLIVARREGRQRFNYLNPVPIQQVLNRWISRYEGPWIDSLIALKDEMERERAGASHGSPRARRHSVTRSKRAADGRR